MAGAAALTLLVATPLLPMTDLPQHEAQVALWQRLGAPGWEGAARLRLNWLTPYLGGTLAAGALAAFLSIPLAFRVLVAAGALALPLSLTSLIRRAGGDPWWALLGLPFAFGLPFAWGFYNFALALPLLVWSLAFSVSWIEHGRRAEGWALAGLTASCLLGHLLAWGFVVGCGVLMALTAPGLERRARLGRIAPYLVGVPPAAAWLVVTWLTNPMVSLPTIWRLDPWARACALPEALTGPGPHAWVSLAALAALGLASQGVVGQPWRWVPLAAALGLWFLGPARLGGTHYACERFAPLILPGLLLVLRPRAGGRSLLAGRALLALLAVSSPLALLPRWRALAQEKRDLMSATAAVESGRLYAFVAQRRIEGLAGEVAGNLPLLIQVERDVWVDYSFCRSFPSFVRLREQEPWAHDPFVQSRSPEYDWLLVRLDRDPVPVFPRLFPGWSPAAQAGSWWLYRRADPRAERR